MKLSEFITPFIVLAASAGALQIKPSSSLRPKLPSSATLQRPAVAVPLVDEATAVAVRDETERAANVEDWMVNLDYQAFAKEVDALGKELSQEAGDADVEHLNKILSWRLGAALIGIGTMWAVPNPFTIAALSTWTYASWTMVAHHVSHGGYNRLSGTKYNSRGFALGSIGRRLADWTDWMFPEAWNIEHNRLHHYHLGELKDPDLVQRNVEFLRDMTAPLPVKYAVALAFTPIWKWAYYAPNTFKELKIAEWKRQGKPLPEDMKPMDSVTVRSLVWPENDNERAANQVVNVDEFFTQVLGPMFISRFVLLPAPLLLIPGVGPQLFGHALLNLILADLLTNIHGFITIVTNHAGNDVYAFDDAVKPKTPSFYVRQIIGSVNYANGNDVTDFFHGWLNYQIEHHVWPDLSMLQYQKAAPRLKAICEKHGVPYVQESVWTRLVKTLDIMVGKATMPEFPTWLEPANDKANNGVVSWKSTNGAIDE